MEQAAATPFSSEKCWDLCASRLLTHSATLTNCLEFLENTEFLGLAEMLSMQVNKLQETLNAPETQERELPHSKNRRASCRHPSSCCCHY